MTARRPKALYLEIDQGSGALHANFFDRVGFSPMIRLTCVDMVLSTLIRFPYSFSAVFVDGARGRPRSLHLMRQIKANLPVECRIPVVMLDHDDSRPVTKSQNATHRSIEILQAIQIVRERLDYALDNEDEVVILDTQAVPGPVDHVERVDRLPAWYWSAVTLSASPLSPDAPETDFPAYQAAGLG